MFVRRPNGERMESIRAPCKTRQGPTFVVGIALHDHQHRLRGGIVQVPTDVLHRDSIGWTWGTAHWVTVPLSEVIRLPVRFRKEPIKLLLGMLSVTAEAIPCLHGVRSRTNDVRNRDLFLGAGAEQDPPGLLWIRDA